MKSVIKSNLYKIDESTSVLIADLVREMESTGKSIIKLQTGDPDFPTPTVIVEAAYSAMKSGYTHYSASRGLPELRQAIADKLDNENNLQYNPENEILVTNGGIHALFIAINSIINSGDQVLIIDPCWMPYVSSTIIAGGQPIRIPTDFKKGFKIDAQTIESFINNKTKLLVLNYPCNPSGAVYSEEELSEIAEIVKKYGLYVISDEIYEKLIFDKNKHISFAIFDDMKERTITINSFSKTYAMTGWRIGYLAGDEKIVSQILKISQYSITNVCTFIQKAAVTALTEPSLKKHIKEMVEIYAKRRKLMVEAINSMEGLRANMPQGAFYVLVDVSQYNRDSFEFSKFLLEKANIATVPGVAYGKCTEGFLRMTFAVSQETIEKGIKNLYSVLSGG